jgi:Rhs element Vgr protein
MPDLSASLPPGTEPVNNTVSRKVFLNNQELSNEISLVQVTINKTFNKIASAKLIFTDGSAAARDFPLSNDDKFKPGTPVKVQLGFDGSLTTVFEGIIIKHAIKVRRQGGSLLTIEAKDKAIKLTGARKSAYFNNKKDSEVMETLAGTGLQKEVEATTFTHPQLVQYYATDWDFLLTRAEANGMFVFTDDGKLIVKKPSLAGVPVITATYGDNIWEFEAEMDARRQVQQVSSQSWDYTQQQMMSPVTGTSAFAENGNLSSADLGTVMGAQVTLQHSGNLQQTQLQDWANAWALRNKLSKAAGRVRVQGNALVKPGTMIALAGVGNRFNGNVFVTGVLHHYEGFWQTDIQFGWREDWFYKKENVMEKPAAGLLPGVNGLQIGRVLEDPLNDTDQQFRVKVHVPAITSGNEGIWARVATLAAGPDRGIYFRPEKDDEVILGFLNDDPREPIIVGFLHNKDKNKWPFAQTEKQFGIVTKEGLKLLFDDTNKKITLRAPTSSGEKTIVINDSGSFEMKDDFQNSIKMDSAGITLQAGAGKDVIINGTFVKINS